MTITYSTLLSGFSSEFVRVYCDVYTFGTNEEKTVCGALTVSLTQVRWCRNMLNGVQEYSQCEKFHHGFARDIEVLWGLSQFYSTFFCRGWSWKFRKP